MCFVAKITEFQEVKVLSREIQGPLSVAVGLNYNIQNISINQCRDLGVARVSLPSLAIFASMQTLLKTMKDIKENGGFDQIIASNSLLTDYEVLKSILS